MTPWIDPRRGDTEDDASSSKRRSLLSLAGSLLVEISLPKLALAWTVLILLPGLLLGIAPIAVSVWFSKIPNKTAYSLAGLWSAIILAAFIALGWFGGRWVFRFAERSFWSLNALAVQPGYGACREALRHLVQRHFPSDVTSERQSKLSAATALASGALICGLSVLAVIAVWPSSYLWLRDVSILSSPKRLIVVALANSIVLVGSYVAVAALFWSVADATMDQPRDASLFDAAAEDGRAWRIAHLSDLHVVGERYGFRIESGRSGPCGNERLKLILSRLDMIHAKNPLYAILITGDMTDAGRSTEWAEFLDAVSRHPSLANLMLMVPGNHDLNIVDRANPARLDLPTSPNKRLRKVRTLSAMAAIQGERVRLVDRSAGRLANNLATEVAPHLARMAAFADAGKPRMTRELSELWNRSFPMVLPPEDENGLGIILLNSNSDAHFSFTNALGMLSSDQAHGIRIACSQFPHACWVIALHHHVVEYPRPAKALSERIGTALINGNWFVRHLQYLAGRVVLMHGHRHVDWIGACAGLTIVSAPSPVMEADDLATCFYVHTVTVAPDGQLKLRQPERVVIVGLPRR